MSARLPRVRPNLRAFDPRPTAARVFAFAALAFLVACDLPVTSAGGNSGQMINPNAQIQVALLVPGGSSEAEASRIAASLENAARMAIADLSGVEINLRAYNTARDPGLASQMAATAVAEGAQIILGPLDAASANAVGAAVAPANINVLAFSNNTAIAGGNVFVLGNTFGNISDRLVSYAASQGISNFMIVHQEDLAGVVGRDSIATSIRAAGGTVSGIESYPFNQAGIFARASTIAAATNASGAQAIFVTDNVAGGLPILATSLSDQGVSLSNTPLIGITRWDASPQAAALPAMQSGMFTMTDTGREAAFRDRYIATYGAPPHPLASIAYDGIAAIGALAATGDRNALTTASLTRASGFAGATGIFRLRPDGSNQRALDVARIVNNQIAIVDPAPQSFGRGGF
ncbi:hypothetical protein OAN307_c39010 [Octadecabacter antarcticus 307]|uniref:Leucine-binding protein domain-containing protein n=1 Tax=Octadecabacter antarcticus 307 TaxID=391626 RepID=M9RAU4_9RHOB|nr:penicillin-binding protein activator [Octadecabacter antarcticus]AGI69337.1 hypothetical protein OAN307_c39010 [Octadecabacter antarcticus 307]